MRQVAQAVRSYWWGLPQAAPAAARHPQPAAPLHAAQSKVAVTSNARSARAPRSQLALLQNSNMPQPHAKAHRQRIVHRLATHAGISFICTSPEEAGVQVATQLGVERIGPQHQAGSDSLLTSATFMKLLTTHLNGVTEAASFLGVLHQCAI